jgi:hypothetical protein
MQARIQAKSLPDSQSEEKLGKKVKESLGRGLLLFISVWREEM